MSTQNNFTIKKVSFSRLAEFENCAWATKLKVIDRAFTDAGYGAGALRAVDFYDEGVETKYTWNPDKREWERIAPVVDPFGED